jgi:hypothetical protein
MALCDRVSARDVTGLLSTNMQNRAAAVLGPPVERQRVDGRARFAVAPDEDATLCAEARKRRQRAKFTACDAEHVRLSAWRGRNGEVEANAIDASRGGQPFLERNRFVSKRKRYRPRRTIASANAHVRCCDAACRVVERECDLVRARREELHGITRTVVDDERRRDGV